MSPYPAGIRFETLRPVPAESVEREPAAAFAGQRLPPLLIVVMPTDPRLRSDGMVEPLALWEARRQGPGSRRPGAHRTTTSAGTVEGRR